MSVQILPVEGLPEIHPGDDLAAQLAGPVRDRHPRDGDVLVVTQKVVSKAEGRLVRGHDRSEWVARETATIVARRGDLVIARTRHGFVCANAGVDASNVPTGLLSLLPEDPDASAEDLRKVLCDLVGAQIGVVITDTFGRPWREGLVNVAIGCAGLPAIIDLRGTPDQFGRELEATVVALADEVAAASGLVMGKALRIPAALVRGVITEGADPGRASDLIRAAGDDLFPESPLASISSRRSCGRFGGGEIPVVVLEEAVRAACTAPSPQGIRPWRFVVVVTEVARRAFLAAVAPFPISPDDSLVEEPTDPPIEVNAELASAGALIVPWLRLGTDSPSSARGTSRDSFLLSGGAAIQNLLLALHAQGIASAWAPPSRFRQEDLRAALGVDDDWLALGVVAAGPAPRDTRAAPPAIRPEDFLQIR